MTCDTPGWAAVQATVQELGLTATVEVYFHDCQNPPDDWPMFQHDVAHTGVTTTSLGSNLEQKWSLPLNGGDSSGEVLWSSPIVWRGMVYVGTDTNWLYATRADTGTHVRSVNLGSPILGTPCAYDGRVYVATVDGVIHGLNAWTLEEEWRYESHEAISGGVTVYDGAVSGGAVYFGTHSKKLHSVSIASGVELSGSPASSPYPMEYITPAIDENAPFQGGPRCYISDSSCVLTAARCDTGGFIWQWHPDSSSFYSSPTVYGGYVLGGSTGDPTPYVYRIADAGSTYQEPTPHFFYTNGAVNSTLAAMDSKLYFGTLAGYMYYVDAPSFQQGQGWPVNLGSAITCSALISSPTGTLFVCTEDGVLRRLNTANGYTGVVYDTSTDISQPTSRASLGAADGRLYLVVGNSSGRYLYCFGQ